MKSIILVFVVSLYSIHIMAQPYTDYIGAGHNDRIIATSSSSHGLSTPDKTLDGSGMQARFYDASRFAMQATFGLNREGIEEIADMGYEAWIDDQLTKSPELTLPLLNTIWAEIVGLDPEAFGPAGWHFNYAWWQTNMTNQDLLRQRMAFALSQIIVTSVNSDLDGWGESVASYYDIFINNAFGNYRDILHQIAKHPAMGYYLSHLNNPREDPDNNIHPDENFAREIMQLFTIGLYQLNLDGTRVLDGNGNPIPTYNNEDIKQLAKVFTGMGGGVVIPMMYCPSVPEFGLGPYCLDMTVPMIMFPDFHEPGSKSFLGYTIQGSQAYTAQTAMDEVDEAIDFLFNHPNTAPFVCYRLIQRFVTSNPTPAYVARISAVFEDNGQGVRGDLGAVIKAILLDVEARGVDAYNDPFSSRLREPFIRYTQICRSLPTDSDRNRYWNNGRNYQQATLQHVMASPTVFNFYSSDYQPLGPIGAEGLVAPEFKLHNTASAVGYINEVNSWTLWNALMYSWEGEWPDNPDGAWLITTEIESEAIDTEDIINEFDAIFTHGQLSDETRQILRDALNPLYWDWDQEWRFHRVRLALYLLLISPDYNIMR